MRVVAGCIVVLALCCPVIQPGPAPMRLAVCEGVDLSLWLCGGVWTFTGNSGTAQWPNGGTDPKID